MNFRFYGSKGISPMLWSVEYDSATGSWFVIESYNEGKTWITNCDVSDEQAGWDFIAGWFAQFYEGEGELKKWTDDVPKQCDLCERSIQRVFVDGRMRCGSWAIMCPTCRINEGLMIFGPGVGQKYEKEGEDWVKTQG